MTDPEIKRIESKVVYKNRWMTVREDRVRRSNGDHGLFGVVDKPDFSLIVPFDGEHFYMVQQYRYPVDGRYWEFPQGSLELNPDTEAVDVAAVELSEETGLTAGSMLKLGMFFQAYGYANQSVHIFLATDLIEGEQNLAPEEQGLVRGAFTRQQINTMIREGEIADLATIAALHVFDREAS